MDNLPLLLGLAVIGYLLGAMPTGAIVARFYDVDLTKVGSGRTGATNVHRALGKKASVPVYIGDFLKGAAAVVIARVAGGGEAWPQIIAAGTAVLGHCYSPWIGFRGGRGVVTGIGGLAMIWPLGTVAAALAFVVGFIAIATTRYVSLGSITGTVVAGLAVLCFVVIFGQPIAYLYYAIALTGFIVLSHRDNIGRLIHGTERKLGDRV